MSEKIAALIEEVKGLTVVELAELVHAPVSYTHLTLPTTSRV